MQAIRRAVSGMLPKNKLRRDRMQRLLIFPDEEHPYANNITRFHEMPELQQISAAEWARLSPDALLERHEAEQRARLQALLKDIQQQ